MNNTFDFKRFGQVVAFDWKRFIRNFGITLIVWISLPVLFWLTTLIFDYELLVEEREMIMFSIVAITLMSAPSRIYGKANLPREGVDFAMMPATSLEKFFSMFIYCSIVTPALTLLGSWIVDCLLTLLPFGGFKGIAMYEDFLRNTSFGDFMMLVVALVTIALTESSIFMFGNKKDAASKKIIEANGCIQEYEIAKENDNIIIGMDHDSDSSLFAYNDLHRRFFHEKEQQLGGLLPRRTFA